MDVFSIRSVRPGIYLMVSISGVDLDRDPNYDGHTKELIIIPTDRRSEFYSFANFHPGDSEAILGGSIRAENPHNIAVITSLEDLSVVSQHAFFGPLSYETLNEPEQIPVFGQRIKDKFIQDGYTFSGGYLQEEDTGLEDEVDDEVDGDDIPF